MLERERPDALLPTLGGQTALNLSMQLAEAGILDTLGVELIGAGIDAIERAEDRELFREAVRSVGLRVPTSRIVTSMDDLAGVSLPAVIRPAFTLGGHGGGFAYTTDELKRPGRERAAGVADRPGARRGVRARLGRVRARGDPRQARQRRHRLLDREPRPDGRAHRRLRHGRAADDPLRRGLPGASRRRRRGHPRGRRRDGRLEHPVRARARDRRAARDRDEPARVPLVGARLEGDRLPDREGRREARRRLHARRDPERPDEDDAGELRADARLRRRQVPALRVREVPRRRPHARHADEVGRRGDGHRPDVPRGVLEGDALARARRRRGHAVGEPRRPARGPPPVVPARARAARTRRARRPGSASTGASTRARARSRPSRTTTTRPSARPTRRRRSPTRRAS